jgi:hemolysin III
LERADTFLVMNEGRQPGRRLRETGEAAAERFSDARDAAAERMGEARDAAAQRVGEARDAAADRISEAREAAADRVADAREAAAEVVSKVKPRLRGVSHQWAFAVALVAGGVLVAAAPDGRATFAAAVYAGSLAALLGTSALYHRVNWRRPEIRRWMRRLDHSMIFLLIAGTVTPFALLVLDGGLATAILIAVWAGALAGIVVELIWVEAPKWVTVLVYLAVGWIGAVAYPAILSRAGLGAGLLIAAGAILYTAGAVIYARQRPDPRPTVFGYHEIFHLLVIAAAALHFAAVAIYAVPAG